MSRYELLGEISLLSPAYLLSVERWPFHSEPPDHFVLLSHLLDPSVSQSSSLMPMHYQYDVRPYLANLRTPPLLFGRRPPQSNCLPCMVPDPDKGPRLEPQYNQAGISRMAPSKLASALHSLPAILHKFHHSPMQSCSRLHHHNHVNFAESQEETVWPSLRHSCRSELTRQGISLP
jgi:hypothetical protein